MWDRTIFYGRGWQTMVHEPNPVYHLVFVNKVLLECRHSHLFTLCLRMLQCYSGRVARLHQRLHSPQCLKYIYRLVFYGISFATSYLKGWWRNNKECTVPSSVNGLMEENCLSVMDKSPTSAVLSGRETTASVVSHCVVGLGKYCTVA